MLEDLQKVAVDGEWLFAQVMQHGDKALRQLAELQTLRRVLNERFTKDKNRFTYTPTGHYRGSFVATPHDLDAQRSVKGSRQWVGYKVHVTETIANEPHFITDIQTSAASQTDNQALDTIQDKLMQRQLVPRQLYVDQGYMSASNVADSQSLGIDLRGRLMPDTSGKPIGFQLEDFHVNIDQQTTTCPAGQQAERFVVSKPNPRNLVAYHVFFGEQCQTCIFFGPGYCTDRPGGRHLSISLHHNLIQERRREQRTDAFQKEMQTRAGVESLISELVRGHGMRRARYRGRAKVHLQMLFTGAAANLKRLAQASKLLFQQLFTRYHFPIREIHGFSVSSI